MVKRGGVESHSSVGRTSVLDHVEELPRVRRLEAGLDKLRKLILARAPGQEIFEELETLRTDLSLLEVAILRNHVQGCLRAAIRSGDDRVVQAAVERIALQLQRLEADCEQVGLNS